jgi:hypothetical protein
MSTSEDADGYAVWTDPETAFSVTYSLPLFQEIEAVVNEGFRRIPHGGIENAGLLLGAFVEGGMRLDAFQLIECEHASGPSFQLSVRDIDRLRLQIAKQDAKLAVVGWFISHSRSDLVVSEREASVFEYLFPDLDSITVLVKPEKFKATRFAFLIGHTARDGMERSFTLPIVSRRSRAPVGEPRLPRVVVAAPPVPQTPVEQTETEREVPVPLVPAAPTGPGERVWSNGASGPVLSNGPSGLVWMMMGAAVAFACLAAYGFYLAGLPSVVPLNVAAHGSSLTVSWPANESRAATEAEIRVNDGAAMPLAPNDKAAGTTSVNNDSESVKIELILRRWMRESHSIVRYLRTAKASARAASPAPASEPAAAGP